MNIAFAWTSPAAAAGFKSETRREWKETTERTVRQIMRRNETVTALTNGPHRGGEAWGRIRVLALGQERASDIPAASWDAEGFGALYALGATFDGGRSAANLMAHWLDSAAMHYVLKFEVVELTDLGRRIRDETLERLQATPPVTLNDILTGRATDPELRRVKRMIEDRQYREMAWTAVTDRAKVPHP